MKGRDNMKILVLNGSPRPGGNTAKLIEAFKEGAVAGGNEVETGKLRNNSQKKNMIK